MGGLLNSFGFFSGGGGGSSIPSENMSYGVASGTDTYTVTLSPAITQYTTGLLISVKFTNSNTSNTVTLNCNSLGAKNILGTNGSPLPIGQINENGTYYLLYDGTNLILQAGMMDRKDASFYRKVGTTTLERWYTGAAIAYDATTQTASLNVIRYQSFIVPKAITIDRIAMEITAGGSAGSLVRLGIYDSSNTLPNSLVLDAGTIAGDSATFQSININQTLAPNLYWLCFVHNSAALITFRACNRNAWSNILGQPSTLGGGTISGSLIQTNYTYGNLPSTFDSTGISVAHQSVPLISLRLSS